MCDLCEYETTEKSHMKAHKESCHGSDERVLNFTNATEIACQQCSYVANNKKDLKRHETQMHFTEESIEVYNCKECRFSTQYEKNLGKPQTDRRISKSPVKPETLPNLVIAPQMNH